jgi:tetratricopeptide (TPR) repeat protein
MRKLNRLAGLAGLSLYLFSSALPAQPGPRDSWLRGESSHFSVYSNVAQGKTRDVTESLEYLRQVIQRFGGGADLDRAPITFVFFKNQKAFVPYMRTPPTRGTVRPWQSHFGEARDYLLVDGSEPPDKMLPWAYGAYAGYLISLHYREMPYWLRAGMGRYYGATDIEPGRLVRIGMPIERHLRHLRQYSMVPLAQLFRVDADSPFLDHPDNLRTYNAQTWLITHFLLTDGGGDPETGRAVFRSVREGVAPEEAIRASFGMDLEGFQRLLLSYARQPTLPIFTLEENFLEPVSVPLEQMSNDEVSYQLGLYLTSAHKPPPISLVEDHLEPLLAEQSAWRADALAVEAQLRAVTGRPEDARRLFQASLELDPKEAISYYFNAEFLAGSSETEDAETARRCLRKAVEIEPLFGKAWALLAESYSTATDPAEGIPYMEQAVQLLPDRPDLAYNLAMMFLDNGDPQSARTIVARYLAGEPKFRDQAMQIIEQHELAAASSAASRAGDLETALQHYRDALDKTTDPGNRASLKAEIERLEEADKRKKQIDRYNAAIELAKRGDYEEALASARALQVEVEEITLRTAIETFIAQLKTALQRKP